MAAGSILDMSFHTVIGSVNNCLKLVIRQRLDKTEQLFIALKNVAAPDLNFFYIFVSHSMIMVIWQPRFSKAAPPATK